VFTCVGALTFKVEAYRVRPWELTSCEVADYIDQRQTLTYHVRGQTIVKITSSGWIRDRVRFSYDGYRRQRLTTPMINQQVVSWSAVYAQWFSLIYQQSVVIKIDPGQPCAVWLLLMIQRLARVSTHGVVYAIDTNHACTIYHGSFGLQTVNQASVVLPVLLPHEEINFAQTNLPGFQLFALVFFQLFYRSTVYVYHMKSAPAYPISSNRVACFQVSPLQRFLTT